MCMLLEKTKLFYTQGQLNFTRTTKKCAVRKIGSRTSISGKTVVTTSVEGVFVLGQRFALDFLQITTSEKNRIPRQQGWQQRNAKMQKKNLLMKDLLVHTLHLLEREEEGGTNTTTLLCERLGLATATDFFCCASCLRLLSTRGAELRSAEALASGVNQKQQ